ncbi:helix-turn-helix domain-containing protein [Kitasatospora sp. NPDC101801]|uniref:helix-turn-helix domain-containing protein n=1 Tax=Kitasatospora sp. NPDC101801 TaxID=3364103 RepID=UPI00381F4EEA
MTGSRTQLSEREEVAGRIRAARRTRGLSQAQVARALGIPRPSVSDIEQGRRGVGAIELKRLATLLGTTADHLLDTQDGAALSGLHPADRRAAELYAGYLLWRRTG